MKTEQEKQRVWPPLFLAVILILSLLVLWKTNLITDQLPHPHSKDFYATLGFQCPRAPFMERILPNPFIIFPILAIVSYLFYFLCAFLLKHPLKVSAGIALLFFFSVSLFSIYGEVAIGLVIGWFPKTMIALFLPFIISILFFAVSVRKLFLDNYALFAVFGLIAVLSARIGYWHSDDVLFPTSSLAGPLASLPISLLVFLGVFSMKYRKIRGKKWILLASLLLVFIYVKSLASAAYLVEYWCGALSP